MSLKEGDLNKISQVCSLELYLLLSYNEDNW